ncbi:hypothetical protein [Methyloversatilis thermotolerans]|uniref:hypothetical protein n=1 Tax=Methyloversatilis thermotolerans TaxID=1346290 RepID=UPI00036F3FAE|nr:hypothetical protein [Methyloversatilis thermotolerans]
MKDSLRRAMPATGQQAAPQTPEQPMHTRHPEHPRNRRRADSLAPFSVDVERSPLGDTSVHLHLRPSGLVALIAALLLHGLALWWVLSPRTLPEQPLGSNQPISVRMIEPDTPRRAAAAPPPAAAPEPPAPRPKKQTAQKKRDSRKTPPRPPEPPPVARVPVPEPAPPPPPRPAPAPDAPTDMASYVAAQREKRRLAEEAAASENAEARARERGPSADDIAAANIKRNLQQPGTNGIFRITRKGVRTAAFEFRGWTTDAGNARKEFIEVDAGLHGDIERAIVQRMIELIRRYYSGDFNWESLRLGRTVVLSARPEHQKQLEDFLIKEFFQVGAYYPQ